MLLSFVSRSLKLRLPLRLEISEELGDEFIFEIDSLLILKVVIGGVAIATARLSNS